MEINYQFFIDFFFKYFNYHKNIKVLDFGCGDGKIVFEMRKKGYDFWGIKNYYDEDYETLLNKKQIEENLFVKYYKPPDPFPFPNEYFDFIYSNQVFEHIKDINFVLKELNRVLKKDGIMVHNFPVKEYLIEGHFRIPIIHWFQKNRSLRYKLTFLFVRLGFGIHKNNLTSEEYIMKVWNFIDNKCFYRKETEIIEYFSKYFQILYLNKDKLLFHLSFRHSSVIKMIFFIVKLLPSKIINKIEKRRGSITILAKKKS